MQNTGADLLLQTVTSGNIELQPGGASITAIVQIGLGGLGSNTPDIFALDVKSSAGDPTGAAGCAAGGNASRRDAAAARRGAPTAGIATG